MYTLHTCTCINKPRVTLILVQEQRHNTDYHALYTIKNKKKIRNYLIDEQHARNEFSDPLIDVFIYHLQHR